jgi:SPP1 family predicted phage head-tail adaptor
MRTLFVDPGALRSEMSLQAATPAPDGLGGHTQSWSEIATVFARIEPISATSIFGPDQTVETVTHRVTLRWRNGVAAGMRFVRQGRNFDIVTVHDPDDTGRYIVCRTREAGL